MWAALGGLLFGALVSRLRLNGLLAFALATIVGAAFVAWLVSRYVGAPPDAIWNEKMILIEERIDQWLVHVLSGGHRNGRICVFVRADRAGVVSRVYCARGRCFAIINRGARFCPSARR